MIENDHVSWLSFKLKNEKCHLKNYKKWSCIAGFNQKKIKNQEKIMSCEKNFDQWKAFLKNSKPIGVWLWLAYKFTESNCR